jgi:hypothetical protein
MPSDTLPDHSGLRASFAIHSESSKLLRLENKQLRELVIQLSKIVFMNVLDTKRPPSDGSPIAPSQPTSFWLSLPDTS